jgi:hypothetical protein
MSPSNPAWQSAQRALGGSTLALVLAVAAVFAFLPPMADATLSSLSRTLLLVAAIAVGVVLHGAFLGIAARRLGRPAAGWVALALLLFPIGGIAALLLLGFFSDEGRHAASAPGA